jgi:hypothetical protein
MFKNLFSNLETAMREDKQSEIRRKWGEITIFPGSIKEYEDFVGYQIEIMDTGIPVKSISQYTPDTSLELVSRFLLNGIEAMVRASYDHGWYGIPVKKKTIKDQTNV